MAMKVISVIIPTRNRAALLSEAIKSVLAQEGAGSLFDLDVVVVDDCSSDATSSVVGGFPDVRYIRNDKCRGGAATRNMGIKASRGEYLAFLDDDDLWLPYKLALQMPVLDGKPELGLVYSQLIVRFENRAWIWPEAARARSGKVFRSMLMGNFLSIPSVLVRRNALEAAGYCDENLQAWVDYDLWLRLAQICSFQFVRGPVAIYRLATSGVYLTTLRGGRSEEILLSVIEKNVTALSDDNGSRSEIISDARTSAMLAVAEHYTVISAYDQAFAALERTIEVFPCSLRREWARSRISKLALRCALATNDPLDHLAAFSRNLMAVTRGLGFKARFEIRALVGRLWRDLAFQISVFNSPANGRAVTIAAARALCADPTLLNRALLRVIVRQRFPEKGKRNTQALSTEPFQSSSPEGE